MSLHLLLSWWQLYKQNHIWSIQDFFCSNYQEHFCKHFSLKIYKRNFLSNSFRPVVDFYPKLPESIILPEFGIFISWQHFLLPGSPDLNNFGHKFWFLGFSNNKCLHIFILKQSIRHFNTLSKLKDTQMICLTQV